MAVDEYEEIIRTVSAELQCLFHFAVDVRTEFAADFARDDDLAGGSHNFTCHTAVGISGKTAVEDEVCDKITEFVGMAVAIFFFIYVGDPKHLLSQTQKFNKVFLRKNEKRAVFGEKNSLKTALK